MIEKHSDPNQNPILARFSGARLSERSVSETIGLCRGILADGNVDFGEAKMLLDWLERNPMASQGWPFDVLLVRLREMLADGILDSDEEGELLKTLMQLTGGGFASVENSFVSGSSSLPLDTPQPTIIWRGKGFVFTGQMACGTRKQCQESVVSVGGIALPGVSSKMNYLVIGSIGSEAWIYSTHGRKIEEAVSLRRSNLPVSIVSEEHWFHEFEATTRRTS